MKKILITLTILLFCFPGFAQDWQRNYGVESFLYDWDVEVEVWDITYNDGYVTANAEDIWSEDWYDVRDQLSTFLYAYYDEMTWQELTVEDLPFDLLIYSWFEYDDPCDTSIRYENEEYRWDIYIDEQWLKRYFNAKRDKDRTSMVSLLINSMVAQWEDVNKDLLKRDLQPFDEIIIEQQQIQESFEDLETPMKR